VISTTGAAVPAGQSAAAMPAPYLHRAGVAGPAVAEPLLVIGVVGERQRHPGADGARRAQDLDARRDLERAPPLGARGAGERGRDPGEGGDPRDQGYRPQEITSLHGAPLRRFCGLGIRATAKS
jgi:hypothetical protein